MDTNVTTTSYTLDDNDSIASAKGTSTARPAKIDLATFTAGTHYPNGMLPKGTVLAKRTSDGLFVGYDNTNSGSVGGADTAVGVLASSIRVSADGASTSTKQWGALQWEGVYKVASAPFASGVGGMDTAAQADLAAKWLFI